MKGKERQQYLDLIGLTNYGLCHFCKYAERDGYSCCEAELECNHPLAVINGEDNDNPDNAYEGADCWGFRPGMPMEEIGEVVGIVLEGNIPHYSRTGELIAIIP
jgi:hypothetical protein